MDQPYHHHDPFATRPAVRRTGRKVVPAAAVVLWAVAVAGGSTLLWRYEWSPGATGAVPEQWPADSCIVADGRRHTLVVLLHPHCPCSRATVRELAVVMAASAGRVRANVLFVRPQGLPAGWEQTELWRDAAAVPGVAVACDEAGIEAARFGAATSGQAVLYDPAGRLLFRGGITQSRGHSGDNGGRAAIVALVNGSAGTANAAGSAPVFGCPLLRPADRGGGEACHDERAALESR